MRADSCPRRTVQGYCITEFPSIYCVFRENVEICHFDRKTQFKLPFFNEKNNESSFIEKKYDAAVKSY